MQCNICADQVDQCPEPEHEACVSKENSEPGEGVGRLPQSVRELCGDISLRRNR